MIEIRLTLNQPCSRPGTVESDVRTGQNKTQRDRDRERNRKQSKKRKNDGKCRKCNFN